MLLLRFLFRSEFVLCLALVALFILAEAITTGTNFFYSSHGWVDHWLYLGQFEFGLKHALPHIENYKASRLLWIWQGGVIFKLFEYPYSNYLIVITSLFKFWVAFWMISRKYLTKQKNVFFYMAIFVFYPTLANNGGWYYHNFEACTWWLLAMWILKCIQDKEINYKNIVWAGVFAGFAISTNLFFFNFLPVFIILSPRLFIEKKWSIVLASLGLILSVAILGLINLSLGGPFDFYTPMLKMIREFNGAAELWKPLLYTESFPLLLAMTYVCLWFFLTSALKRNYRPLSFAFLYSAGVYLYWHIRGVEVLAVNIHNSFLLMMAFLALIEVSEGIFSIRIKLRWSFMALAAGWWLTHYFPDLEWEMWFSSQNRLSVVFGSGVLIVMVFFLILLTKSHKIYYIALLFIPITFSPYRIAPEYSSSVRNCHNKRMYSDVIFSLKKDIQSLPGKVLTEVPHESTIANAIDHIGLYSVWPRLNRFSEECTYGSSKAIDYKYKAIIIETKATETTGGIPCRKWRNYNKVLVNKKFELCNGNSLNYSIVAAE